MPLTDREQTLMKATATLLGEAEDKVDGVVAELRAMIRELDGRIAGVEARIAAAREKGKRHAAKR